MREVHCEVLVVGAGPAGLAAAATAAAGGADVLVVDENPQVGGQIWRAEAGRRTGRAARGWIDAALARGARFLAGVTVFDAPHPPILSALDRTGTVLRLAAERTVLATGATERFLPFPGWTLPGVFGAGGLQAMVKSGMAVAGERVVVAGSGPLLIAVAAFLKARGARVLGVFEQAPRRTVRRFGAGLVRHPTKLVEALGLLARLRGVPILHDALPVRAEGSSRLEHVVLTAGGSEHRVETDLLACGFGLVPAVGLARLCGCAVEQGKVVVDALQRTSVPHVFAAGEAHGIGGVDVAVAAGRVAGHAAVGREDLARAASGRLRRARRFGDALETAYLLRDELRDLPQDDTVVCRCEAVTFGTVRVHRTARQAKLATRCGMGLCQGRVCGPALEFLCGFGRDSVRPPLVPVPSRALADYREPTDDPNPDPENTR